jgi:ribosomal protein S18 acetylase RimI-like enzyme
MSERLEHAEFWGRYVVPFCECSYIYDDRGWIVWRRGTGDNVELLHIRAFKRGQGDGKQLLLAMLNELKSDPPYHSVFGFTRVGNVEAKAFYGALGFELQDVNGVYRDGEATLFWQAYERLMELHQ